MRRCDHGEDKLTSNFGFLIRVVILVVLVPRNDSHVPLLEDLSRERGFDLHILLVVPLLCSDRDDQRTQEKVTCSSIRHVVHEK